MLQNPPVEQTPTCPPLLQRSQVEPPRPQYAATFPGRQVSVSSQHPLAQVAAPQRCPPQPSSIPTSHSAAATEIALPTKPPPFCRDEHRAMRLAILAFQGVSPSRLRRSQKARRSHHGARDRFSMKAIYAVVER